MIESRKNPQKTYSAYILRQLGGILYGIPLIFMVKSPPFAGDIPYIPSLSSAAGRRSALGDHGHLRQGLRTGAVFFTHWDDFLGFLGSIGDISGDL